MCVLNASAFCAMFVLVVSVFLLCFCLSTRTNQMNDLTIRKEHVRTGRGIPSSGLLGKDLSNVLHQVEPDASHVGSRSSRLVPPL